MVDNKWETCPQCLYIADDMAGVSFRNEVEMTGILNKLHREHMQVSSEQVSHEQITKACKDCRHFVNSEAFHLYIFTQEDVRLCDIPLALTEVNFHSGRQKKTILNCAQARENEQHCGRQGRFWEQKLTVRETLKKSFRRFWRWLSMKGPEGI